MNIIDAHIHFRPDYESFSRVAEVSGHVNSEEHIKHVFEKNKICHAIVMGNLEVEPECHKYPDFMSYCIGLDSNVFGQKPVDYFVEMVERNLMRPECVGIKLYPGYCHYYVYDNIYDPFYELAAKYGKPVAVHTGAVANTEKGGALLKYSHPLTIDEAAVKHKNVNFVMCHFGNPWLCDAASVVEKNKNVFADISGILEGVFDVDKFFIENENYINMIKTWIGYLGDYRRVMYGTDWPIVNIESYLNFAKRIIPEKEHENVFFENAKNIYGIKNI